MLPASEAAHTFGTAAEPLALNGYLPFALKPGTKEPMARGYQDPLPLDKLRAAAANGSAQCGVGLLAGAKAPDGTELAFLDADIYAPEPSAAVLAVLDKHLPGAASLRRVGLEPKWAVPVRVLPGTLGRTSAKFAGGHHLQLLTAGRYLAAFGTHPDTHRPYEWPERSPLDVPLAELPLLTEPVWDALCAELYEHAEFWGWQVLQDASTGGRPGDTDVAPMPKTPVDLSREQVRELIWLFRGERFGDDTWHKMGMALHHQSEGAEWGRALWVEWSGDVPSGKFGGFERWDSFGNYRGERRTLATYLWRAKREFGWTPREPPPVGEPVKAAGWFRTMDELLAADPPQWLVKRFLPRGAFVLVAGKPKTGKSFLVSDLALAGARGLSEWFGLKLPAPFRVLYLNAEGSMTQRLTAYVHRHGREAVTDRFVVITRRLKLNAAGGAELRQAVAEYEAEHGVFDLIVVDTVARAMTGNENSPDDMGAFVDQCEALVEGGRRTVIAVHHFGKDEGRGSRGHTSLPAAVATQINVEQLEGGIRKFYVELQRDEEALDAQYFRLQRVAYALDADGDELSSVVVVKAAAEDLPAGVVGPPAPTGRWQRLALEQFKEAVDGVDPLPVRVIGDRRMVEFGPLWERIRGAAVEGDPKGNGKVAFRQMVEDGRYLGRVQVGETTLIFNPWDPFPGGPCPDPDHPDPLKGDQGNQGGGLTLINPDQGNQGNEDTP